MSLRRKNFGNASFWVTHRLLCHTVAMMVLTSFASNLAAARICPDVGDGASSSCWRPSPDELPKPLKSRAIRIELSNATISRMAHIAPDYQQSKLTQPLLRKLEEMTRDSGWEGGAYLYFDYDLKSQSNSDCSIYLRRSIGVKTPKETAKKLVSAMEGPPCGTVAYDLGLIFEQAIAADTESSSVIDPYQRFLFASHPDKAISDLAKSASIDSSTLLTQYMDLPQKDFVSFKVPVWKYKTSEESSLPDIAAKYLGQVDAWPTIWALNIDAVDDPWKVTGGTVLHMPPVSTKWLKVEKGETASQVISRFYSDGRIGDFMNSEYSQFLAYSEDYQLKNNATEKWVPVFDPTEITSTGLVAIPMGAK